MIKRNNKKGFTIVELVIVIAVIAILAGVLIPTFASVVSKANASNALQAAKNAYTNDLALLDGQAKNYTEPDYNNPTYTEVAAEAEFDANATYYTKTDDNKYEAATGLTGFEESTKYYTVAYDDSICEGEFAIIGDNYTYTYENDEYTCKYSTATGEWTVTAK